MLIEITDVSTFAFIIITISATGLYKMVLASATINKCPTHSHKQAFSFPLVSMPPSPALSYKDAPRGKHYT